MKSLLSKIKPGLQFQQLDLNRQALVIQHDAEQQLVDAVERRAPAEDFQRLDVLPAGEGRNQPAQAEDVVEMRVRQQDAVAGA